MVHTTYQSGAVGKRMRLREVAAFEDPPEYYTAEFNKNSGFLSMELSWPQVPQDYADWNDSRTEEMIVTHLNGMVDQLAQIRAGMAMAVSLGRTFVMPKVWCCVVVACLLDQGRFSCEGTCICAFLTVTLPLVHYQHPPPPPKNSDALPVQPLLGASASLPPLRLRYRRPALHLPHGPHL